MKVGNTTIFKYRYPLDYKLVADEMDHNVTLDQRTSFNLQSDIPAIQSYVVIQGGWIDKITTYANNLVRRKHFKNKKCKFTLRNWLFIVQSNHHHGDFHDHLRMQDLNTTGEWAWVYYVTMPNKDEGKILFKENDEEISYQPKPGDLLVFPSHLLHFPEPQPNSNHKRRVIAGNMSEVIIKGKTII